MKKLVVLLTISMICVASASAWTSVYSDDFEDGVVAPWVDMAQTGYGSPYGVPITESGGAVHTGTAHWALSPYDASVHSTYKMSVEVNFNGFTWLEIYAQADGTQNAKYTEPSGIRFDYWGGNIAVTDWTGAGAIASVVNDQALTGFTGGTYNYEIEDHGLTMIARMIDPANPANMAQTTVTLNFALAGGQHALGADPGGPGWPGLKTISYDNFDISVPEPATICLLGIGALSLIRRKRA